MASNTATEEEISGYAQYLISQGQNPQEVEEYANYLREQHRPEEPSTLQNIFQTGMKALDYAGGIARVGAAQNPLIQQLTGGSPLTEQGRAQALGDIERAIKGEAPTASEYLERAGVPEMGALSDVAPVLYSETGEGLPLQKGGAFDPTTRGAIGMAADIATDPLTWLTGGAAPAAKAATRPMAETAKALSRKMYKSAFKEADLKAAKFKDMPAVSDIMEKYNIYGTTNQVFDQATELLANLKQRRDEIIQAVDEAGVPASMKRAFEPGRKAVSAWAKSKNRIKQKFAKPLKKTIDEQIALGEQEFRPTVMTRKVGKRERVFTEGRAPIDFVEQQGRPDVIRRRAYPSRREFTEGMEPVEFVQQQARPDVIRRRQVAPASEEMARKGAPAYETTTAGTADPQIFGASPVPKQAARAADPDVFRQVPAQVSETRIPGQPGISRTARRVPETLRIKAPYVSETRIPGQAAKVRTAQGVPERLRIGKPKVTRKRIEGQAYQPPPTLGELMDIKTSFQGSIPKKAYEQMGRSAAGNQLSKKVATGIKKETERVADVVGLGDELRQTHKEMGTLLNTIGVLDNEAAKAVKKNLFTEVDAALAVYNPLIFFGKQAGKVGKSSWFRTGGGKALGLMGKALDPYEQAQRRFLINLGREEQ